MIAVVSWVQVWRCHQKLVIAIRAFGFAYSRLQNQRTSVDLLSWLCDLFSVVFVLKKAVKDCRNKCQTDWRNLISVEEEEMRGKVKAIKKKEEVSLSLTLFTSFLVLQHFDTTTLQGSIEWSVRESDLTQVFLNQSQRESGVSFIALSKAVLVFLPSSLQVKTVFQCQPRFPGVLFTETQLESSPGLEKCVCLPLLQSRLFLRSCLCVYHNIFDIEFASRSITRVLTFASTLLSLRSRSVFSSWDFEKTPKRVDFVVSSQDQGEPTSIWSTSDFSWLATVLLSRDEHVRLWRKWVRKSALFLLIFRNDDGRRSPWLIASNSKASQWVLQFFNGRRWSWRLVCIRSSTLEQESQEVSHSEILWVLSFASFSIS